MAFKPWLMATDEEKIDALARFSYEYGVNPTAVRQAIESGERPADPNVAMAAVMVGRQLEEQRQLAPEDLPARNETVPPVDSGAPTASSATSPIDAEIVAEEMRGGLPEQPLNKSPMLPGKAASLMAYEPHVASITDAVGGGEEDEESFGGMNPTILDFLQKLSGQQSKSNPELEAARLKVDEATKALSEAGNPNWSARLGGALGASLPMLLSAAFQGKRKAGLGGEGVAKQMNISNKSIEAQEAMDYERKKAGLTSAQSLYNELMKDDTRSKRDQMLNMLGVANYGEKVLSRKQSKERDEKKLLFQYDKLKQKTEGQAMSPELVNLHISQLTSIDPNIMTEKEKAPYLAAIRTAKTADQLTVISKQLAREIPRLTRMRNMNQKGLSGEVAKQLQEGMRGVDLMDSLLQILEDADETLKTKGGIYKYGVQELMSRIPTTQRQQLQQWLDLFGMQVVYLLSGKQINEKEVELILGFFSGAAGLTTGNIKNRAQAIRDGLMAGKVKGALGVASADNSLRDSLKTWLGTYSGQLSNSTWNSITKGLPDNDEWRGWAVKTHQESREKRRNTLRELEAAYKDLRDKETLLAEGRGDPAEVQKLRAEVANLAFRADLPTSVPNNLGISNKEAIVAQIEEAVNEGKVEKSALENIKRMFSGDKRYLDERGAELSRIYTYTPEVSEVVGNTAPTTEAPRTFSPGLGKYQERLKKDKP